MAGLNDFDEITERNAALAPLTALRLGGPADFIVQPRSRDELAAVLRVCMQERLPLRVLGGGCNVLVREEGVRGVVLRLTAPAFTEFSVQGQTVRSGAGAALADLISQSTRHGLAGLEVLVGISRTVGGAVHGNAGDRHGEIAQFVRSVEVLDEAGEFQVRDHDELRFAPHESNIDDPVIVAAEFELEADDSDDIVKRMRKAWIQRKATQPLTLQRHARLFKDPRGLDAAALIEQADLGKAKVGGAEISSRYANAVVVHPDGTAADVQKLIELVRDGVREQIGVELETELTIW